MKKNTFNLKKSRISKFYGIVVLFFFSICLLCAFASAVSYTLAPPSGTSSGETNTEYEYYVNTMDTGSKWKFDWGDGTFSDWIELSPGESSISQMKSWSESGTYEVKVKSINSYSVESSWSEALTVYISVSSDIDGDGWDNELEESYGTDAEDSTEFPTDTDNDGTPDESSPDLKYEGDTDDDNDGLSDEIENQLESDSKDNSDVKSITISQKTNYLVDIDKNGIYDKFFNTDSSEATFLKMNEDSEYLIDVDGNSAWDYTYIPNQGITEFHEEKPFPWLLAVPSIIVVALVVIFILFKMGLLYVYEEEYVDEDKN